MNGDPSYRYTWLIWSAAFLLTWAALLFARPKLRRRMLWASALTTPFGLTEPALRAGLLEPSQPVRPGPTQRIRHRKPGVHFRDWRSGCGRVSRAVAGHRPLAR